MKDDLGYVCRICGVVDKAIESIFEFQYSKVWVFSFKFFFTFFYFLVLTTQLYVVRQVDLHLDASSWVFNKLTEFLNGHEYWGFDVSNGELYHLLMGIFDMAT